MKKHKLRQRLDSLEKAMALQRRRYDAELDRLHADVYDDRVGNMTWQSVTGTGRVQGWAIYDGATGETLVEHLPESSFDPDQLHLGLVDDPFDTLRREAEALLVDEYGNESSVPLSEVEARLEEMFRREEQRKFGPWPEMQCNTYFMAAPGLVGERCVLPAGHKIHWHRGPKQGGLQNVWLTDGTVQYQENADA